MLGVQTLAHVFKIWGFGEVWYLELVRDLWGLGFWFRVEGLGFWDLGFGVRKSAFRM